MDYTAGDLDSWVNDLTQPRSYGDVILLRGIATALDCSINYYTAYRQNEKLRFHEDTAYPLGTMALGNSQTSSIDIVMPYSVNNNGHYEALFNLQQQPAAASPKEEHVEEEEEDPLSTWQPSSR